MALMKDEELRKIVACLVGSKNPNKITVVKAVEGNGTRRYFFYKKKGAAKPAKYAKKAGRMVGEKLIAASPLGAVGVALTTVGKVDEKLAGLNDAYTSGVLAMAADTGDYKQNSNLMHAFKANGGIRAFGILDHIGQMSFGLWISTLEEHGSWLSFLAHMDSADSTPKLSYHLKGDLFRGPRVLFNSNKKEHQRY